MQPCRDCQRPTPATARSCPACGILNPVMHWVSLPDGAHLTHREPATPAAAAISVPRSLVPPGRGPAAAPDEDGAAGEEIRKCANAFYGLGALNVVGGMVLYSSGGGAMIFEGVVMAGLAFLLRQYRSRAAGVVLVLYAGLTTLTKVAALMDGGGRIWWILLWAGVTGMAFKATMAAYQIRQQRALVPG